MSFIHTALLIVAVSAVGIADIFLKKIEATGSMWKAITSPWMVGAIGLYLFQIFFFTYLFIHGAKLVHVGILQTVLYAVIVLVASVFFFGETLSSMQIVGIILALVGVLLVNLG